MRGKGRKNLIPSFDLHVKNSLVEQQELCAWFGNRELQKDINRGTNMYFLYVNYFNRRIIFKHENGKDWQKNAAKNTYQFTKALPGACSMPYIKH